MVPSTGESKLPGVIYTGESKLPGVLYTGESRLPSVLYTGESFFVFLNIQVHATAFKATFIQKLFYISIYNTNRVQTYLKNFPS